ncbi:hypothetical protein [Rubrimonas cliftonensis]|uniref:hypothetical protein n=1 Tax=Rubrimonas cliftonensis TaxID=89524 RepID=UPI001114DB74|nr:hypothetical protein [Rubrimonas cliftonensis]
MTEFLRKLARRGLRGVKLREIAGFRGRTDMRMVERTPNSPAAQVKETTEQPHMLRICSNISCLGGLQTHVSKHLRYGASRRWA